MNSRTLKSWIQKGARANVWRYFCYKQQKAGPKLTKKAISRMKTIRTIVKSMLFRISGVVALLLISGSFIGTNSPQQAKIKVVCIDPGHGGKDPGCHGDIAKEKDVALAVALKLGKYITDKYPNVKVVYTRKTDVFVELDERAAIANRNNADLFICIHCNSACVRDKRTRKDVCNETAEGSETYIMGLHKNNGNLEVAKRENDAALYEDDYQTKYNMNIASDEAIIILSTYQNLYQKQSMRFAEFCQEQFSKRAGRTNKGVKQAGFLVLWKTSMPSVLIETGFLTNPIEERFLGSEKGQSYMASCIFRAFRSWKDEIEGAVKPSYNDDLENEKPFVLSHEDTVGLRKPVNYVNAPKPATTLVVKVNSKDSAIAKPDNHEPAPTVVASTKTVSPVATNLPASKSNSDTRQDSNQHVSKAVSLTKDTDDKSTSVTTKSPPAPVTANKPDTSPAQVKSTQTVVEKQPSKTESVGTKAPSTSSTKSDKPNDEPIAKTQPNNTTTKADASIVQAAPRPIDPAPIPKASPEPVNKSSSGTTTPPVINNSKPSNTAAGTGNVYRVQFLSSDKVLPDQSPLFKGVTDVWHYEHKGAHKYTSGSYTNSSDAMKRMEELRKAGFKDAFVVVFDEKGNRIR